MPKHTRKTPGQPPRAAGSDLGAAPPEHPLAPPALRPPLVAKCESEAADAREEGLAGLAALLLGGPEAAQVVQLPGLGALLLERCSDGVHAVRLAATGALRNLLLLGPAADVPAAPLPPPLDLSAVLLANLSLALRHLLHVAEPPMPALPAVTPPAAEQEAEGGAEPGFDKKALQQRLYVALAAQSAAVLLAVAERDDRVAEALERHEAAPLACRWLAEQAAQPAPPPEPQEAAPAPAQAGEDHAELETELARLLLVLTESDDGAPPDAALAQTLGPALAAAVLPCLAAPPGRFTPSARVAIAGAAANLMQWPGAQLDAGSPVLAVLSAALAPDLAQAYLALLPALLAQPAAPADGPFASERAADRPLAELREAIRAQKLALQVLTNLYVSPVEDLPADDDDDESDAAAARREAAEAALLAGGGSGPAPPPSAAGEAPGSPWARMQGQLQASPEVLPTVLRKCLLPAVPPALTDEVRALGEELWALHEAALDCLLNVLLSHSPLPAPGPAQDQLWQALCGLCGDLIARQLLGTLGAALSALAAFVRVAHVPSLGVSEAQLDGLLALGARADEAVSPCAIEAIALLRDARPPALQPRLPQIGGLLVQCVSAGPGAVPPATLAAALNAVFDLYADHLPPPDQLLPALAALGPQLQLYLRQQRRAMDRNVWERLDEARINLRRFLAYKAAPARH